MKTFLHSPLTLLLLSLLGFSTPSLGGEKDSLYSFEIDGRVAIPKTEINKSYKIVLLCHNVVVDSGTVVDDESFLLRVKKNSLYTIRIIKQGYLPMVVTIDTRVPYYQTNGQKFNFDDSYFLAMYGFHLSLSLRNHSS